MRLASVSAFIACIAVANWAISTWGVVSVGFGLSAPAGVYFAGLAFTCRDLVRESSGRWGVALAIAAGAAISFLIEDGQRFAFASACAFTVSESVDALVYEPLRARSRFVAVALSNTAGLVADSALFLWLAFGSVQFIEGQVVGKAYMTAFAVLGMVVWRALSQRSRQAGAPA